MSASKLSEQLAEKAVGFPSTPCTHDMEGEEDICNTCMFVWENSVYAKAVAALDEMALRVFEDTRERAAKIAADAIAPNRRDIAAAILAMPPDPCPK